METSNTLKALLKKELRNNILNERNALSEEEHIKTSKEIEQKIKEWSVYKECTTLLTYVNFKSEVMTLNIIESALESGKKVYCPKVNGDDMFFYQINSLSDLTNGYMGIMEPDNTQKAFDGVLGKVLILIPGSVFDKTGNRIGYGKGFYDRFLIDCHNKGFETVKTALAFSCQIVEDIPAFKHDCKMDYIVTEKEIIKC